MNGPGYAYSHQSPELVELVAKACGLELDERAKGIAHNFIESGVDINLLRSNPEIYSQLGATLKSANSATAASAIAATFSKPLDLTLKNLELYLSIPSKYDLSQLDQWVELWSEIVMLLLHHKADKPQIKKALILATQLTSSDYQKLFGYGC